MSKAQKVIRLVRESDAEKQRRIKVERWRQKAELPAVRKVWHPRRFDVKRRQRAGVTITDGTTRSVLDLVI